MQAKNLIHDDSQASTVAQIQVMTAMFFAGLNPRGPGIQIKKHVPIFFSARTAMSSSHRTFQNHALSNSCPVNHQPYPAISCPTPAPSVLGHAESWQPRAIDAVFKSKGQFSGSMCFCKAFGTEKNTHNNAISCCFSGHEVMTFGPIVRQSQKSRINVGACWFYISHHIKFWWKWMEMG